MCTLFLSVEPKKQILKLVLYVVKWKKIFKEDLVGQTLRYLLFIYELIIHLVDSITIVLNYIK